MSVAIGRKVNGGVAWLGAPAAACWRVLLAQGMPGTGITDAGRTPEEQAVLWDAFLAGQLKATAARPGSPEAHHEDQPPDGAHAVDAAGATQAWLLAHHPPCWSRPLLHATKPETWHWEHDRSRCHNQGGTEMDANEHKLLQDTRTEVGNVQGVVDRLNREVLAPGAKLDTLLQYVTDIRNGVGGLPALLAALDPRRPTDPSAVAAELARALGPQVAAQVAQALQHATVTITPGS